MKCDETVQDDALSIGRTQRLTLARGEGKATSGVSGTWLNAKRGLIRQMESCIDPPDVRSASSGLHCQSDACANATSSTLTDGARGQGNDFSVFVNRAAEFEPTYVLGSGGDRSEYGNCLRHGLNTIAQCHL